MCHQSTKSNLCRLGAGGGGWALDKYIDHYVCQKLSQCRFVWSLQRDGMELCAMRMVTYGWVQMLYASSRNWLLLAACWAASARTAGTRPSLPTFIRYISCPPLLSSILAGKDANQDQYSSLRPLWEVYTKACPPQGRPLGRKGPQTVTQCRNSFSKSFLRRRDFLIVCFEYYFLFSMA